MKKYNALGVEITAATMTQIAELAEGWVACEEHHMLCFNDMYGIVKGHDDQEMRRALASADIVCPDGNAIAMVGRLLYGLPVRRLCGPDFMEFLISRSPNSGLRHYFFGGKPGVAEELSRVFISRYPGLRVAGFDTPPMGPSSPEQLEEQLAKMKAAQPDVVWVGLGAPKQEIWVAKNGHRLPGVTFCAVGAAFDFYTNRVRRAPQWMRDHGLEWFYRAASEPRRLGLRYAKTIPRFGYLFVCQAVQMMRDGSFRRRDSHSD
jgi:N-acetylglucosaminyldiphosphoundecaprenol N-acetyl-beta-D-mannosaminyltransferase